MSWRWSAAGWLMLGGAGFLAVAVGYVWRRRGDALAVSLLVMLLAALEWSVAYALELSADPAARQRWGDLKYVGICLLTPAWLAFVFHYTGRARWPSRLVAVLLAIEPLAVLLLLANDATHDLIRFYPADGRTVADAGPLFWVHLIYTDALLWLGTAVLILSSWRLSRLYRRQGIVVFVSVLLPWAVNLLFNLDVGPFGQVDLSPFAFTLTAGVLVFGVFRFSLLDQRPMARSQIFETINDPVLVLDPWGRIIDANPAAERLVGRPTRKAVGRSAVELLPALGDRTAGQATASELTVAARTYDLVISSLPGRPGRRGGQLVVARDVSERRQAEQALRIAFEREQVATERLAVALQHEQAATEHLRSLDELKSAFMQAVSHDLRTPLASVLGIALTLERNRGALPTADVDDLHRRLSANARRLDRILGGLLDLDRLTRGLVEPRRERVDLAVLVATAVEQAKADLVGNHPIHVDLASVEIAIDSAKVERIVENLLVNASRHTPPGTPVWVRVDPCASGALLTVADAGPGVPDEQRELIFQPFHRGPGATGHSPGSGVGLALVAQIAGLHGGRAWVEPRAGGGASFQVLLPDGPDVAPPAGPMSPVTG
ncbi:MAG TPA: histidine kinase N-terminal 7TM domain-containing protein [Actinomycetes bacterium]